MLTSRALDRYALQNPPPYFTFPQNAALRGDDEDAKLALAKWQPLLEPLDNYLERGGSPNSRTLHGCPLVVGLTRAGDFEKVKLLLRHPETNAAKSEKNTFRTALMEIMPHYIDREPKQMIELADALIESIQHPTSRTSFVNLHDSPRRNSALSLATKWELDGMVELLLSREADPFDPAVTKLLGKIHSVPRGVNRKELSPGANALRIKEMIFQAQQLRA